jgi:hypothetical protein
MAVNEDIGFGSDSILRLEGRVARSTEGGPSAARLFDDESLCKLPPRTTGGGGAIEMQDLSSLGISNKDRRGVQNKIAPLEDLAS